MEIEIETTRADCLAEINTFRTFSELPDPAITIVGLSPSDFRLILPIPILDQDSELNSKLKNLMSVIGANLCDNFFIPTIASMFYPQPDAGVTVVSATHNNHSLVTTATTDANVASGWTKPEDFPIDQNPLSLLFQAFKEKLTQQRQSE